MSVTTVKGWKLGHRTIGTAEEMGCDTDGGKWVVICEKHDTLINVDTLEIAWTVATFEFCERLRSERNRNMTNTMAWDQLGATLTESLDAGQAMKEGKLAGWNVRKVPLVAQVGKKQIPVPGRFATVRNNPIKRSQIDILGDVGANYNIIQNENHEALLNALVDESGATLDYAGDLGTDGRQVFIVMKLPGHINVGGSDPVENYLAAINSHDGSMSFTLMVTPVRFDCKNVLNCAFQNASHMFRVRHTSGAEAALHRQAREALDFTFNYLDVFQKDAERLIQTTMTQAQFESIMVREFGAPEDSSSAATTRADKKIDELSSLFADSFTQEGIRGTAWAGFNALTEWADHRSPTRGAEEMRDSNRAQKAILDPSFKNRALQLMMSAT